jgi:hypothetical protein
MPDWMGLPLILIIYPVGGFCLLWLYYRLRQSRYASFKWIVLPAIFIYIMIVGLIAQQLSVDVELYILPFIVLVIALFAYFWESRKTNKAKIDTKVSKLTRHSIIIVLILLISFSPLLGLVVVRSFCFHVNVYIAQPLVEALDAYENMQGHYPIDLNVLAPEFIDSIPQPVCMKISNNSFDLALCPVETEDGEIMGAFLFTYIALPPQQYDMIRHEWTWANWAEWYNCDYYRRH